MNTSTLLPQSLDDDDTRLQKLLTWAKSRPIWINDEITIGRMSDVRHKKLLANSMPLEISNGKRKNRDTNHNERQCDLKRVAVEGIRLNEFTTGPIKANRADVDSSIVFNGEHPGKSEEDYDERARGQGFGVYVKPGCTILERQVVILIPKSTMLSARTSSLSPYIPSDILFSSDASSGLLLTLVLLHEYLLGRNGQWWGYLQSLPRQKNNWGMDLPLSLKKDSDEWKAMEHTEAGRMIKRVEADAEGKIEGLGMSLPRLQSFFENRGFHILKQAHPDEKVNNTLALLEDFVRLYSIISSRTFVVDMYHGMCLVPIADMFNHSESSNINFEADDEVCDECGSLGSCAHNSDPLPSLAYGRPSAFLPATSGPNSANWKPPKELENIDTVDMVAQREIQGDDEAYNTYGNFSNANLLTIYGFCLEYSTEWDRYVWEWRYEDERREILEALHLFSSSKTRDLDMKRGWMKTFAQFSEFPAEYFAEVLILQATELVLGSQNNSTSNRMPSNSPFVALTKPIWDTEEDSTSAIDVESALSNLVVDLSNHDGTKDKYQPFFIDSEGKVSMALWRIFALINISEYMIKDLSHETSTQMEVLSVLKKMERTLATILHYNFENEVDCAECTTRYSLESNCNLDLLCKTLKALQRLVSTRLQKVTDLIEENGCDMENGIEKIIEREPSLRRSIAIQAWQEYKALGLCNASLNEYIQYTRQAIACDDSEGKEVTHHRNTASILQGKYNQMNC